MRPYYRLRVYPDRIYEGTFEILQNIIGVFRMKLNVRSKGAFYDGLAFRGRPAVITGR